MSLNLDTLIKTVSEIRPEAVTFAYNTISQAMTPERDEYTLSRFEQALDAICEAAAANGLVRDEAAYTYLVARNANNEGIYLVWHGAGSNTDLTEEVYEAITEEADAASLAPTYHVYSRRNLIVTDDVVWYQIPDRILSDFGLDVRHPSRGPETECEPW